MLFLKSRHGERSEKNHNRGDYNPLHNNDN